MKNSSLTASDLCWCLCVCMPLFESVCVCVSECVSVSEGVRASVWVCVLGGRGVRVCACVCVCERHQQRRNISNASGLWDTVQTCDFNYVGRGWSLLNHSLVLAPKPSSLNHS